MGVFRNRWEAFYIPRRKLPTTPMAEVSAVGISKVHPSRNASLRDDTFRVILWQYYLVRRVSPPAVFVPGTTNAVQLVHPSRNPRLRDGTFRPPFLDHYQPKRVLPPSQFVPGTLLAVHPRLRNVWDRKIEYRYYRIKRTLPPSIFIAGILVAISQVHPSRNRRLRDETFRPPFRSYYQPKYLYLNVTPFIPPPSSDTMFKEMSKGMFKSMEPF